MTWRALAAALMALLCGTASAAEFYQGKQVTIVVGFSSGGTYDATARLFARHLGKYLPGKPTVIVRNMPGAGSLIAAKSLHSSLPKDGTTIGVVGGGLCWSHCSAIRRRRRIRGASTGSGAAPATISSVSSGTRCRCRRCKT